MTDPYDWIRHLYVDGSDDKWYIINGDWENKYAGPYKTAAAAKGQLTRLKNGYTPAAKRDF